MATYSTDADILALDLDAADFRPVGETTFERLRKQAYAEIGRRLARRDPPVDQAALGLVSELKHAEVLYVLHRLYFDAAAKVGEADALRWRSDEHRKAFESEIATVAIPSASALVHRSVRSVPVWRR